MGVSTGDLLGGGGRDDEIGELNTSFNQGENSKTGGNNQQVSSFPVTQALVSLLAADSSLFQGSSNYLNFSSNFQL